MVFSNSLGMNRQKTDHSLAIAKTLKRPSPSKSTKTKLADSFMPFALMANGKPFTHLKKTKLKSLGLDTRKKTGQTLSHFLFLATAIKSLAWALNFLKPKLSECFSKPA